MTTKLRLQNLGPKRITVRGGVNLPPGGQTLAAGESVEVHLYKLSGLTVQELDDPIQFPEVAGCGMEVQGSSLRSVVANPVHWPLDRDGDDYRASRKDDPTFESGKGGDFGGGGASGSWGSDSSGGTPD